MKRRQQAKAPKNDKKNSKSFIGNQHAQTFTYTGTSINEKWHINDFFIK